MSHRDKAQAGLEATGSALTQLERLAVHRLGAGFRVLLAVES